MQVFVDKFGPGTAPEFIIAAPFVGLHIFEMWQHVAVAPAPVQKKVAVDGPVVNAGELGSSTFSPGQALPAGPLGLGQRWTVARKREVVLRLLRDEPVQLLSRQLGVEIFRLEQWREKAIGGIDASLKQRKGDPVQAELDSAMKRIGELTMQVELLEAKTETFGPLGRRRSRR